MASAQSLKTCADFCYYFSAQVMHTYLDTTDDLPSLYRLLPYTIGPGTTSQTIEMLPITSTYVEKSCISIIDHRHRNRLLPTETRYTNSGIANFEHGTAK